MHYKINHNQLTTFAASFYDDTCSECQIPIEIGDPISYLNYKRPNEKEGPFCFDCTNSLKAENPTIIEVTRK